jgi:hypothetical protein
VVVDGVILFFCHLKVSTVHHLFSQILLFVEGDKWKTLPHALSRNVNELVQNERNNHPFLLVQRPLTPFENP